MKIFFFILFIFFTYCTRLDELLVYDRNLPPKGFGKYTNLNKESSAKNLILIEMEDIDILLDDAFITGITGTIINSQTYIVAYGNIKLLNGTNATNNLIIFTKDKWNVNENGMKANRIDSAIIIKDKIYLIGRIETIDKEKA